MSLLRRQSDPRSRAEAPAAEPLAALQAMREAIDKLEASRSAATPSMPRYLNVEAVVEDLKPDEPVFCLRPGALRSAVAGFAGFPGRVLYAVKCNPHPAVLRALYESGVTDFDVASAGEIADIARLFGKSAGMFFNNPVKSRSAIEMAERKHGVLCYTIDHESELDKILEVTGAGEDLVIAVRLATRAQDARYALTTKFGAASDYAAHLLKRVHAKGLHAGLTFHVGSQCLAPQSFTAALSLCGEVIREAGVPLEVLNVGGGFPAAYPGDDVAPLEHYLAAITYGLQRLQLAPTCRLYCEPGRSLVATGGSVLTRVLVRKDKSIYLNDGIFGSLQELRHPKERRPARLVGRSTNASDSVEEFKVYGPTCDSDDVLGAPLMLPDDVKEGDWIEIGMMGAYSLATRTEFNGFSVEKIVTLDT